MDVVIYLTGWFSEPTLVTEVDMKLMAEAHAQYLLGCQIRAYLASVDNSDMPKTHKAAIRKSLDDILGCCIFLDEGIDYKYAYRDLDDLSGNITMSELMLLMSSFIDNLYVETSTSCERVKTLYREGSTIIVSDEEYDD